MSLSQVGREAELGSEWLELEEMNIRLSLS